MVYILAVPEVVVHTVDDLGGLYLALTTIDVLIVDREVIVVVVEWIRVVHIIIQVPIVHIIHATYQIVVVGVAIIEGRVNSSSALG